MRLLENFNIPIYIKESMLLIKNFFTRKAAAPDGFIVEFYQIFEENIIKIMYKLF